MRTEERWKEHYEQQCVTTLPPRISQDLLKLNLLNLPDQEVVSTFIYGKIKTGKTIRAAQLFVQEKKYNYLHEKSKNTLFISFPELFAEIRSAYNNPKKTEEEVLNKYLTVDFLIIDDFLTARPTEWVMEILYRLINYRYENLKKTIITSNLSLQEIEARLQDQRITSRIDRMCVIEEKQSYKTT